MDFNFTNIRKRGGSNSPPPNTIRFSNKRIVLSPDVTSRYIASRKVQDKSSGYTVEYILVGIAYDKSRNAFKLSSSMSYGFNEAHAYRFYLASVGQSSAPTPISLVRAGMEVGDYVEVEDNIFVLAK